ncbi:uncharacterized protein LOC124276511 [Haliotis rubra]|uniref:uncharacterized protein LOC124276511 n=1 Tax=Haliotis rubra TaxID=36100 RepID=UPI001EE5D022|nr:uncharacterized protein LOC124276511 [Haliotis rubra]
MDGDKSRKHFHPMTSARCPPLDGNTVESWSTSRDLDQMITKQSEVSSAYLQRLERDRNRLQEVQFKSMQNIPYGIREMISSPDTNQGVAIRRWVALPRTSPRQTKKTHTPQTDPKGVHPEATPRRTQPSHRETVVSTPRNGLRHSVPNTARDSVNDDEVFGVTNVPFKCPSLSSSRKKNCCIPSRLDSQIALRKAMRSQIEQQRSSALTNHVQFVTSNTLNGTRLTPPKGLVRPGRVNDTHSFHRPMADGNLELLAILSVQEHNIPMAVDEELSLNDTYD